MSRAVSARRRGLRKKDAHVSLFPFLAVLICTMGALIVLLVVLVQQAKVHAAHTAEERRQAARQATQEEEERRLEKETFDWRYDILQTQKGEIAQRLTEERLRLSHVEDHHRRLQAELQSLANEAAEMERLLQGGAADTSAAQAELARLHQAIAAARARLEEARRQAETQPQSFALIPYEGPAGTHRRPIYIECLRDRIILQPEGITLTERDFTGPLGPGNPLDAALRAAREHLARTGGVARHGEPYPLLVVRSQGPRSYAAARAALESWDDEFGYELVDDDLRLHFPPADPAMKEAMQAAIEEARRRQEILRVAQPLRFKSRSIGGFEATPRRGGFQAVGEKEGFGGGFGGPDASDSDGGDEPDSRRRWRNVGDSADRKGHVRADRGGARSPGPQRDASAAGQNTAGGVPGGSQALGDTSGANTPLAASRGRNWGLKGATENATPYTRPITVECFADKLVLVPERGSAQAAVTIPMNGSTRSAIDPFVQALWRRMDGWGLAGARAYWKPIVRVEVAPGAEDRFLDFQQLLDESGLVIERKTP